VQTCLYHNSRDRMVILRCIGSQSYFLEKVIFPFETWTFNAPQEADVELWCHGLGGAELLERLNSDQLQLLDAPETASAVSEALNVTIDCLTEAEAAGRALKI
jgi:Domain of unknown function (DUF1830)